MIPLGTSVIGDVTVVVYHARSTFGGKIQGKVNYKFKEFVFMNLCTWAFAN